MATQLGNQGQATEEARLTCEIIQDGAIGPVREVLVSSPARFWSWTAARPTGDSANSGGTRLGSVVGPRPRTALSSRLLPLDVAELVGLRHRASGRPLVSQAFDGVQAAETRPPGEH